MSAAIGSITVASLAELANVAIAQALALWPQFAVLALALWIVDAVALRRAWPMLRLALHGAVLLKLALPASLASPVSLARALSPSPAAAADLPLRYAENGGELSPAVAALLLAVWAAGTLLVTWVGIRRARGLRQTLRAESRRAPPPLLAAARGAARRLGVARLPEIRVSASLPTAALIGAGRALIVVPAALLERGRERERDHALLHELVHWRRRDAWFGAVAFALCSIWWFQPFAWLVARRATLLRELCCDDAVRRVLRGDAPAYRMTLLDHARKLLASPALPGAQAFLSGRGALVVRLEALARERRHRPWCERLGAFAALCFALVVVVPMGHAKRAAVSPTPSDWARQVLLEAASPERAPGCMRRLYAVALLSRSLPSSERGID